MLLERISKDQKFYKSLKRLDKGDEDEDEDEDQKGGIDQEVSGDGDGDVHYDEIDSSQTIHEAIAGMAT